MALSTSTKQAWANLGLSTEQVNKVEKRIGQLPNALTPDMNESDRQMWTAIQKLTSGQDRDWVKQTALKQIANL